MQNIFISEGNLGSSPTLKYVPVGETQEQKPVVELDVRFDHQRRNRQTGDYEDTGGFWGRVQLWGKRAEYLNQHLVTGCRVLVVGEYNQEPYVATKGARQGQEVISNQIRASHIGLILLGVESVVFTQRSKPESVPSPDNSDNVTDAPPVPEQQASMSQATTEAS